MDLETGFLISCGCIGAAVPAVAFLAGFRSFVEQGLGFTKATASKTKEGLFGNYLYVWSDVGLGVICYAAAYGDFTGKQIALLTLACHQVGFLMSSAPVYGFRPMYIACGITTLATLGIMLNQ